jgi:hypothetical protein
MAVWKMLKRIQSRLAIWRSVATVKDAHHHNFAMFIQDSDGPESKMMTMEYTRRK